MYRAVRQRRRRFTVGCNCGGAKAARQIAQQRDTSADRRRAQREKRMAISQARGERTSETPKPEA